MKNNLFHENGCFFILNLDPQKKKKKNIGRADLWTMIGSKIQVTGQKRFKKNSVKGYFFIDDVCFFTHLRCLVVSQ